MQIKHFFGFDVSKNTLDLSLVYEGRKIHYCKINNNKKEIKKALDSLKKEFSWDLESTVFCMEHTGIYKFPLVKYLVDIKAKIWIESGIQIKKSLGIARGKNDKVDSERIAMYAFTNAHKIRLWTPPRPVIEKFGNV